VEVELNIFGGDACDQVTKAVSKIKIIT